MTRRHTADGLATRTIVRLDFPGDVFSLSPDGSGPTGPPMCVKLTVGGHPTP